MVFIKKNFVAVVLALILLAMGVYGFFFSPYPELWLSSIGEASSQGVQISVVSEIPNYQITGDQGKLAFIFTELELWPPQGHELNQMTNATWSKYKITGNLKEVIFRLRDIKELSEDVKAMEYKERISTPVMGEAGTIVNYTRARVLDNGERIDFLIYIDSEWFARPQTRPLLNNSLTYSVAFEYLIAFYNQVDYQIRPDEVLKEKLGDRLGSALSVEIKNGLSSWLNLFVKPAYAVFYCSGNDLCEELVLRGTCSGTGNQCSGDGDCPGFSNVCNFSWTCGGGAFVAAPPCGWNGGTCQGNCAAYGNACSPGGVCSSGCSPSCSSPLCGQANGCGGSCSTASVGVITWGGCYDPGGCGNHSLLQNGTDPCGNTYQQTCGSTCGECGPHGGVVCGNWTITYDCRGPDSGCQECGPHYGAWGACTAPSFSRSRPYTMDCSGPGTQTEGCSGTFFGTAFDASIVEDCNTYQAQPPVVGATVTATALTNHTTAYPTTTNSAGDYSTGVLVPDNYDISYLVDPTRYVQDPPKLLCDGGLTGISITGQAQTIRRRIGLYRIYGGWFQVNGGDVYGHNGVSMSVPATCVLAANQATCNSYTDGTVKTPLVVAPNYGGTPGTAGIVFSRQGTLELGGGGQPAANATFSESGYNAEGAGYAGRRYDYGYFARWAGHLGSTTWNGTGLPTGAANALYQHTGDVTWGQSLTGTDKMVVLVDGNVTINANVDVPVGAYLAIIASGNITFTSGVTQAEGHFIGDQILVEGTGVTSTDQRFVGEGSFIGWDGVSLNRDRGLTNNSESSEYFIHRPDLVINAPRGIRNPTIVWQEVNP